MSITASDVVVEYGTLKSERININAKGVHIGSLAVVSVTAINSFVEGMGSILGLQRGGAGIFMN